MRLVVQFCTIIRGGWTRKRVLFEVVWYTNPLPPHIHLLHILSETKSVRLIEVTVILLNGVYISAQGWREGTTVRTGNTWNRVKNHHSTRWNKFSPHPRSIINDFRPINAIFAVEVRQESDFVCRAIRTSTLQRLFLFFRENRDRFSSATIRKRFFIDARSRNWLRAFHAWARGKNLSQRCRVSPFLFPFYSLPSSLFQLPFISSVSLSLSRSRQSTGTLTIAMDW